MSGMYSGIGSAVAAPGLAPGIDSRLDVYVVYTDIPATLAERRADWRRRVGLAGRNLQLDVADDLLRHNLSLIPWRFPSGRGAGSR